MIKDIIVNFSWNILMSKMYRLSINVAVLFMILVGSVMLGIVPLEKNWKEYYKLVQLYWHVVEISVNLNLIGLK